MLIITLFYIVFWFVFMFVRFRAIKEYYRIPSCSVLSYLIVLLRLYTSFRAIFYYNIFTVIMKKGILLLFYEGGSFFERVVRLGARKNNLLQCGGCLGTT